MVLFSLGEINKNIPGNFERSLTSNTLYQHLCKPPSPQVAQARIRIPFNPTFRTFRWYIKWNEIYIWSDRNIRDQLWRWSTLTGLVGPNWQNWKLLSSVPFFCIQLTRTITKRAAAWVGSVQQECTVPYIWASGISEILYRNFCWMQSPPTCPWYKYSINHGTTAGKMKRKIWVRLADFYFNLIAFLGYRNNRFFPIQILLFRKLPG